MGGFFRKVLVFLVLVLGLGIPIAYWVKGKIARAETRNPLSLSPGLEEPAPLKIGDLSLPPLPGRSAPPPSPDPEAATLEVHLQGEAWRDILPRTLTLVLQGPEKTSRMVPLEGGTTLLRGLLPGTWSLEMVPSPPGSEAAPLWKGRLRLQAGTVKKIQLPPPPLANLVGKVTLAGGPQEKCAGIEVRLFTQGGVRTTRTGPAGTFTFKHIIPGMALLVVAGGPSSAMGGTCQEIRLEAGTPTKVALELRR